MYLKHVAMGGSIPRQENIHQISLSTVALKPRGHGEEHQCINFAVSRIDVSKARGHGGKPPAAGKLTPNQLV